MQMIRAGKGNRMVQTRISDPTRDRYHALSISSVWNLDRVRKARCLVVGGGALGNEVVKNLAMMGVRFIAIVDFDTVEVSNLTRSIFFREADHGRGKAEVLAARVRDFNREVAVLPLNGKVEEAVGLGLVRRMDMVFSCLDNRLARRVVNRMCQKVGKPWVDGATENLIGEVSVYLPDRGPCYECTLTRLDREIIARATSCRGIALAGLALGRVPTTSTMSSIIAAIQVQEALNLLHGANESGLAGKRLVVNCAVNDFYQTQLARKPDCPGHFRFGSVREMPGWSVSTTTPREILERFREETGEAGHLRLGRDVVLGIRCPGCSDVRELDPPRGKLRVEEARCPRCGRIREPTTTNVVRGNEPYTFQALERLGIPPLDVLEVRGDNSAAWYEMTGDTRIAECLPSAGNDVESGGEKD